MSGKRRRGRGSRSTGGGRRRSRPRRGLESEPSADQIAAGLAREVASEARKSVREVSDGLDGEMFASWLVSTWGFDLLAVPPDVDPAKEIGLRVVSALERAGDRWALAALRALASVDFELVGPASRDAADRLAEAGVKEPGWRGELGAARGVRALVMRDAVFDDATNVILEFDRPGSEPYSVLVLIDHNLGGIAKDIIVGPTVAELTEAFASVPEEKAGSGELKIEEIALDEAAARCREAVWRTEHTMEPPVAEDFKPQVTAVAAHLRLLPGEETHEPEEVSESARRAALDGFLASPEAEPFGDDEDVADLARLATDFGADHVGGEGRPLRWSPTVVELFMCDYLPRKVLREPDFFRRSVPRLLEAWVRYAGRCRGIPASSIEEAVDAVAYFRDEMLGLVDDEEAWGPAKTFMAAAEEAGVDVTDEAALKSFIDDYNSRLAA